MDRRIFLPMAALMVLFATALAQVADPSAANKPLSPVARLAAAHTVFLKNAGGSELPFNVISQGLQGWGRFQMMNTPEKSDIIIEVTSPATGGGVSVSSGTSTDQRSGVPVESSTTTRELSVSRITLIVYDAKSKMALWSASEQPKGGLRGKARKDHIVQAAELLVAKLRQQVEPDSSK